MDHKEYLRWLYGAVDPWHYGDSPFEKVRHDAMSRLALTLKPHRVLDLGCGEGHFLENLLEHAPDIQAVGVEYDERAAARARNRLNRFRVELVNTDLLDYLAEPRTEKRQSFDVVFCGDVLYYLCPPLSSVDVAQRVVPGITALLRPQGGLVLSYTDVNSHKWTADIFLDRFRVVKSMSVHPEQKPPPWPWMIMLMVSEGSP